MERGAPKRLFFALWPNQQVRAACAAAVRELRRQAPSGGGYPTPPQRYHLTLLFLGDALAPEQEVAVRRAADALRLPAFDLVLDQAGSFCNRKILWWLGSRQVPAALDSLYQRLCQAVTAAGVHPEPMRFVPHLTVLRGARAALATRPIEPIGWRVDEFVLIRSQLDRRPVEYERLERWTLDAPPAAGRARQAPPL